jgi:cardiolipin synthase
VSDAAAVLAVLAGALYVADVVIKVVALGLVPANRRPSSGMAWLLLILAVPFLGLFLFLVLGRTKLERQRRERQREVNERIRENVLDSPRPDIPGPAYVASVAALNENLGALPVLDGNHVELLPGYGDSLAAMVREIDAATRFVHVEFYIAAWDDVTAPVFEALARATERGVPVRFLFDHLGSRGIPVHKEMLSRLEGTGIEWHPMLPFQPLKGRIRRPDLRNHRKILVVDGRVAFTGSQNLIEPGYDKPKNHAAGREWVELMARVEGPAAQALNALFATDWYSETGVRLTDEVAVPAPSVGGVVAQVVPSGPGFPTENNLRMFTTLIYGATRRVSLTSPYFVPDESILYAVTTAARRGVDVELFVGEAGDQFMVFHAQCSYYRALLDAGVRIYRYPAPYVLHSKHFTIDDDVAVLGSSNMDLRSFTLNYEVSLMLVGPEPVARLREVEDSYRAISKELTAEEWGARGRGATYVDNVMRLTAALQ